MKCSLRNSCARRDWCCNFCTIKCPDRCTDKHDGCPWFEDKPIDDYNDKIDIFTFVKHDEGYTKQRKSRAEMDSILAAKRSEKLRRSACTK